MQEDNTKKDLDDFWTELIDRSEWAKNEGRKNTNEFKNLNILGAKKKVNNTSDVTIPEVKIEHSKGEVSQNDIKSLLLTVILAFIFVIIIFIIIYSLIYYFYFYKYHVFPNDIGYFSFKSFLLIFNVIKNI